MAMWNKKRAFTLVETMVVLVIFSSSLLIGLFNIKKSHSYQNEAYFFKQFDESWQYCKYLSNFKRCYTTIKFHKAENNISFDSNGRYFRWKKVLRLPADLKPFYDYSVIMDIDGYTKPQTIYFTQNNKNKYKLSVQLGWGIYELTKLS